MDYASDSNCRHRTRKHCNLYFNLLLKPILQPKHTLLPKPIGGLQSCRAAMLDHEELCYGKKTEITGFGSYVPKEKDCDSL